MGIVIDAEQRQALIDRGVESVPETIMATLSSNHAVFTIHASGLKPAD